MESSRESILHQIRTSLFEGEDRSEYAVNHLSISPDSDTTVDSKYTYSQLAELVNQCASLLRSYSLSPSSIVLLALDVIIYLYSSFIEWNQFCSICCSMSFRTYLFSLY